VFFFIIENMNPNYNIIPCFVEKISKQHLKFVIYQNRINGFLFPLPQARPIFLIKKIHYYKMWAQFTSPHSLDQ
jgi:hypothetical protein